MCNFVVNLMKGETVFLTKNRFLIQEGGSEGHLPQSAHTLSWGEKINITNGDF